MSAPSTMSKVVSTEVPIESIVVMGRHRKDLGDLDSLAASIEDIDLLNPITITPDGRLIAGQRRLEACRGLGRRMIPARIVASLDEAAALLRAERDENTERKEMLLSEKASLGEALYAIEEIAARQRQLAAQARGRATRYGLDGDKLDTIQPERGEPGSEQNKTRAVVGEALGMSGGSYNGLRFVYRTAHDTEIAPHVRQVAIDALAEMDRTGKVNGGENKVRAAVRANREALEAKAAALAAPVEPDELDSLPAKPAEQRRATARDVIERRARIEELAGQGWSSRQIAAEIGVRDDWVRKMARENGIHIGADDVMGRTRKIDSNRVVRESVFALDGVATGVQLANVNALDPAEIDGWISSMTDSLRVLNRFVKQLKEKTREA